MWLHKVLILLIEHAMKQKRRLVSGAFFENCYKIKALCAPKDLEWVSVDTVGDLVCLTHDKIMVLALCCDRISQVNKGVDVHPLDFYTKSALFTAHHVGSQIY